MRTIKFRGKSKSSGEWFFGNYFDKDTYERTHIQTTRKGCLDIIPETVGQFTGLTDINGKEIYEGDIIQFGSQLGSVNEVKYIDRNAAFLVKDKFGDWQLLYDVVSSTNCEIIGNIYDNPELLNKQQ